MTHLVGNYPNPKGFQESLQAMFEYDENGVDYLEIQLPFKNPLVDGALIYQANLQAISYHIDYNNLLNSINKPQGCRTKLILMSYLTPVQVIGFEKLCIALAKKDFYGFIIPDLIFGSPEQKTLSLLCNKYNLVLIPVISPVTNNERLEVISSELKLGQVIYAMARFGKTGEETELLKIQNYIDRLKLQLKDFEIAVGFGIKEPEQVKYLNQQNLIAIIGTEIVKQINNASFNNNSTKNSITQYLQTLN